MAAWEAMAPATSCFRRLSPPFPRNAEYTCINVTVAHQIISTPVVSGPKGAEALSFGDSDRQTIYMHLLYECWALAARLPAWRHTCIPLPTIMHL